MRAVPFPRCVGFSTVLVPYILWYIAAQMVCVDTHRIRHVEPFAKEKKTAIELQNLRTCRDLVDPRLARRAIALYC